MGGTPHHTEMALKVNAVMADGRWYDYEKMRRMLMPLIPPGVAMRRTETERLTKSGHHGSVAPLQRVTPRPVDFQIESGRRRIVADFLHNTNFEVEGRGVAGSGPQPKRKIRLVRPFRVTSVRAEPLRIARDQAMARAEMLEQQQKLLKDYLHEIGHGQAAERLAPARPHD